MPRLDTNTPWPTNLIFAIFGKIDGKDTNSPWDLDINDSSEVERRLNNVLLQIDERGADILVLRFKNKMTYEEIGKKVYEKHIREENISIKDDLKDECSKIDELSEIIKEARMELLKLKDLRQCKNCYEEIDFDDNFCPKCGEKQEDIKDEAKEVEILEKLENSDVSKENQTEAEIVKENLEEDIDE